MKSEQIFIVFEGNSIRIPQKGHINSLKYEEHARVWLKWQTEMT